MNIVVDNREANRGVLRNNLGVFPAFFISECRSFDYGYNLLTVGSNFFFFQ